MRFGSKPWQRQKFGSRVLFHLHPKANSAMMSTLTAPCQWEDDAVTDHSPPYVVAKKLKSLTLHTHGCHVKPCDHVKLKHCLETFYSADLIDVTQPLCDVVKGLWTGDVVYQDDTHCSAIVRCRDGMKSLLSSCIPLKDVNTVQLSTYCNNLVILVSVSN